MIIYTDKDGDKYSVLTINKKGELVRVKAPFRVLCVIPVKDFKTNTQLYVEAVIGTENGQIVYIIFQQPYLHSHFIIHISF